MYNVQDLKVIVDGVTDNHLAVQYRDDLHIITEDRGKPTVIMIITVIHTYIHTYCNVWVSPKTVRTDATKINYIIFNKKFKKWLTCTLFITLNSKIIFIPI